jgi:hypothetical protein
MKYLTHRIIWLISNGKFPVKTIDHVNGNRADNRLVNLREATYKENSQNRVKPKNNTSGTKGISWSKKSQKWKAYITTSTREHLGYFSCLEDAIVARKAAEAKHHKDFQRKDV